MSYNFKNADKLKRNREIEGETGTEIGFPGGDTLWILAATDANPRWVRFGDDYINGLRRLQRANASDERVKAYQAEWFNPSATGSSIPWLRTANGPSTTRAPPPATGSRSSGRPRRRDLTHCMSRVSPRTSARHLRRMPTPRSPSPVVRVDY